MGEINCDAELKREGCHGIKMAPTEGYIQCPPAEKKDVCDIKVGRCFLKRKKDVIDAMIHMNRRISSHIVL